jgi:hypothetical protein
MIKGYTQDLIAKKKGYTQDLYIEIPGQRDFLNMISIEPTP